MSGPARRRGTRAASSFTSTGTVLGRLVAVDEAGRALVDFPGNCAGPLVARTVVRLPSRLALAHAGQDVILAFDGLDTSRPIIMGLVADTLVEAPAVTGDALIDGRRIEIVADREIVLRCGRSSITLTADGRIVVKGEEITSRASATQRIKGASVAIN